MTIINCVHVLACVNQFTSGLSKPRKVTFALLAGVFAFSGMVSPVQAESPVASFDVPQIAVANPVDPAAATPSLPGNRLIRVTLSISAFIDSAASQRVDELLYQMTGYDSSSRVVDYWPKTEGFTTIDGTVGVEKHNSNNMQFGLNLSATPPPLSKGDAVAQWDQKSNTIQKYQRLPDVQVMIASGSVRRGAGVYFSLRRTPIAVLDGCRDFHVLMEVGPNWRSGVLYLDLTARQIKASSSGRSTTNVETLGVNRYQVLVVEATDTEAINLARKVLAAENELRYNAEPAQRTESKPIHVTVFKKVAEALEINSEPLPDTWLTDVLFDPRLTYPTGALSKLPVNTRANILAYQDAKRIFLKLNKAQHQSFVAQNQ